MSRRSRRVLNWSWRAWSLAGPSWDLIPLLAVVVVLGSGSACRSPAIGERNTDPFPGMSASDEIVSSLDGLSGLATDADGRLWVVSELGLLGLIKSEGMIESTIQIHGLEPLLEVEALAVLPNGDFVLGTEVDRARYSDKILLVRQAEPDGRVSVYRSIEFDYREWSIEPPPDHGVEGVCATDSEILAVGEPIVAKNGRRLAPLGRWDMETEVWQRYYVELTSERGKLSGLSCRIQGDRVEFVAIERDFGITHILRGALPSSDGGVIQPKIARNWSGIETNLEGVSWQTDGTLLMIDDNFYRARRSGSSRLYHCILPVD